MSVLQDIIPVGLEPLEGLEVQLGDLEENQLTGVDEDQTNAGHLLEDCKTEGQ